MVYFYAFLCLYFSRSLVYVCLFINGIFHIHENIAIVSSFPINYGFKMHDFYVQYTPFCTINLCTHSHPCTLAQTPIRINARTSYACLSIHSPVHPLHYTDVGAHYTIESDSLRSTPNTRPLPAFGTTCTDVYSSEDHTPSGEYYFKLDFLKISH